MLRNLADGCHRHRWAVLGTWIALLAAVVVLNNLFGGVFRDEFTLPGSESQEAFDLLEENGMGSLSGFSGQVVFTTDDVRDPAVQAGMEDLFADLQETIPDSEVVSPYGEEADFQISEDGTIAYASLNLSDRPDPEYDDAAAATSRLVDRYESDDRLSDVRIEMGGEIFVEEPEFSSEVFGLAAAVIILLVAFGSLLAMGLPLLIAGFGVGTGAALVGLLANLVTMPTFSTQAVMMIGIGVGIDYSLFIVTRYREELSRYAGTEPAVRTAMVTAGRAVLVAGGTVIIAVLGLVLVNIELVRGLAVGICLGVLMTMLATQTLLPAVLGFVGRSIDRFGLPHRSRVQTQTAGQDDSTWHRWSRVVQRRPWPALLISVAVLLLLAVPLLSLRLGFGDAGNRPTSDTTRRAYDLVSEGFGPGANGPLILAIETPGGTDPEALQQLWAEVSETPGVRNATPPQPSAQGTAAAMIVIPETSPQDAATTDLVHTLRDEVIPPPLQESGAEAKVGGLTAAVVDFADYMSVRLYWLVGAVLVLSFAVLVVMFRSLVVPLKAVIMNLLSVGAAYGVLVAVFQWGWGNDLLGIGREGPIDAWIPMMVFAIVFGLSMDYEVFLLSRIREHYDRTGDNATAVADGLASTARVITAAAAIMVCVFGAFVLGDERALQMFGLGLAVAIAVDASLVRLVVVPSAMELLGDRNWWLPGWLGRILPAPSSGSPGPERPVAPPEPSGDGPTDRDVTRPGSRERSARS